MFPVKSVYPVNNQAFSKQLLQDAYAQIAQRSSIGAVVDSERKDTYLAGFLGDNSLLEG